MTNQLHGRQIKNQTIPIAKIEATGTRDSTTFLRGDGTFAVPTGGGGGGGLTYPQILSITNFA